MGQRSLWIVVEQFTGRDEMPGDGIGGALVEGDQFAADIGGKLLGVDVGWDTRRSALTVCVRLSTPGTIRAGTIWRRSTLTAALTTSWYIASGAARGPGCGPALLAMSVVGHGTLSPGTLNSGYGHF